MRVSSADPNSPPRLPAEVRRARETSSHAGVASRATGVQRGARTVEPQAGTITSGRDYAGRAERIAGPGYTTARMLGMYLSNEQPYTPPARSCFHIFI